MYGITLSVVACLRAGTRVDVAWVVETEGLERVDRTDALALTPGGGRVGSLLSGALDDQLSDQAARGSGPGHLLNLEVSEVDALVAGLPSGGRARCLLVPATNLPAELWPLLAARQPVALITELDGDQVAGTTVATAETVKGADEEIAARFARRASDTVLTDGRVVTILWPVPQLVIVGFGPVADALAPAAALLGWQTRTVSDPGTAGGLIAALAGPDKVVVASHDQELAGRALAAALDSDVGYIGALGGRRAQQTRADWLAYRGHSDLSRIHGPAGLDIGAETPAEIALSILAEAVAVQAGVDTPADPEPTGTGSR